MHLTARFYHLECGGWVFDPVTADDQWTGNLNSLKIEESRALWTF